jgi:hypothetical protein
MLFPGQHLLVGLQFLEIIVISFIAIRTMLGGQQHQGVLSGADLY